MRRMKIVDCSYLFCGEEESVRHLFFECVVIRQIWELILEVVGFPTGSNFESIAKCWLCNVKFGIVNMVTSAVY
jgi:hypothetical protein